MICFFVATKERTRSKSIATFNFVSTSMAEYPSPFNLIRTSILDFHNHSKRMVKVVRLIETAQRFGIVFLVSILPFSCTVNFMFDNR